MIEQSNGSRLSYAISSSLCLTHLEQIRHANVTDDHILIPVSCYSFCGRLFIDISI
jgi:hypothetical protein